MTAVAKAADETRQVPRLRSVERALAIVEAIADQGGIATLTQIARASAVPAATAHRILGTLLEFGYVSHAPDRRYRLGPKFMRLGEIAVSSGLHTIGPLLRALADRTGETAALLSIEQDAVVTVAHAMSTRAVRVVMDPGMRPSPHCSGAGKILLAEMDDSQVLALLERTGLPAMTPKTITSVDVLFAELKVVRRRGYAADFGELENGLACVAVPIKGPRLYALAIAGPEGRIDAARQKEIVPILKETARAITAILGGPSREP